MSGQIFMQDLHNILSDKRILWEKFKNAAILISGATGQLGNILIQTFSAANKEFKLNIKIIALGRNDEKGKALESRYNVIFLKGDIREKININLPTVDYIFHCAAVTKSKVMVKRPVDVITTEIEGTKNILDFAYKKKCKSIIYFSSMEVYGQTSDKEVNEEMLGFIDLSNARNCYPESKRLSEMLCKCHFEQYGTPVKIVRLARIFGAGTPNNLEDTRVALQFARKAIAGEDIELHTQGASVAPSCYTADALLGILLIMQKGENGEAYNIANPKTHYSVKQTAEIVADDICKGKIKVIMNTSPNLKQQYAEENALYLSVNKLTALGWEPKYNIKEMFERMIYDWDEEWYS